MPKRSGGRTAPPKKTGDVHIEGAGTVVEQKITDTLTENYMPYAMSVILSRAIPEIDGFKPSHRKLLYTMYKEGLLTGDRKKSANIVGKTMQLNPHGDMAIYDTMVRLSRGYEALLHPYVDSKGNFGKAFSRDMQCAASRYTEAKLDSFAAELFRDIDKDTVDFVDNYDSTMKEPVLFPVTFPSVLVNSNTGIAVGMASSICSFNLAEVCETAAALIKNPEHEIADTLKAPDFAGGGLIIYNRAEIEKIFLTGRGGVRVRSVYSYDRENNCIDITQIPPTTTCEAIIEKVIELAKLNKLREVSDIRDETGIEGLRITIDLKRGVDPDQLMRRLYRMTTLEDTFSCNFNILIKGSPKVMGVKEILNSWTEFRMEAVKRRTNYEYKQKSDKLHLLMGLSKILLDIDKAIRIVRETNEESEVIPNLMIGFGIDEIQAEYVAEIKLRHLNREYILKRTSETESLKEELARLEDILNSPNKIKGIIVRELAEVAKKYGKARKSKLIYATEIPDEEDEEESPDYPVSVFFSKHGYFKKITPQSLRMSGEQKLKDNDEVITEISTTNNTELLFFSDRCTVYKAKLAELDETKASLLGDYIPTKLSFEADENAIYMVNTKTYGGYMIFAFENGKLAKIELSAYMTKTNRKRLINAYSDKSPISSIIYIPEDCDILLTSSSGKVLIINTAVIASKTTKNSQGINVMTQRKNQVLTKAELYIEGTFQKPHRYRPRNIPSAGYSIAEEESQTKLSDI